MSNLETITVSVDASYIRGYGACAYYIKHEKFVVKDTQYLGEIKSNIEAEYQGIIVALTRCISELRDRDIKLIYLTCDCIPAIERCRCSNEVKSILGNREIKYQHINAHIGTSSPRTYVNDWCDRMSRSCLKDKLAISNL